MPSGLRSSLSALRFSGVKEVKYLGGGGNAAESALGGCSAMAICRCRCWTWGLEVRDLTMSRYAVGCVGVRTGGGATTTRAQSRDFLHNSSFYSAVFQFYSGMMPGSATAKARYHDGGAVGKFRRFWQVSYM